MFILKGNKNMTCPISGNKPRHYSFDAECIERYGKQTCILYQIDQNKSSLNNVNLYKLRYLDDSFLNDKIVGKTEFYELIPYLLEKKYTVVVAELVCGSHIVIATHRPNGEIFSLLSFY